jgi:hypothetical protein
MNRTEKTDSIAAEAPQSPPIDRKEDLPHQTRRKEWVRVLAPLLGAIPSLVLCGYLILLQSTQVTISTDLFVPFIHRTDDLSYFLSPWHPGNFGSAGSSPNGYLYAFLINDVTQNAGLTQHFLSAIPIPIGFATSFVLLGRFNKGLPIRILFANLYIFNAVVLNQIAGATGLLYVYAFAPATIYFALEMADPDGKFWKPVSGYAISGFLATFFLSETVFFLLLYLVPIALFIIGQAAARRTTYRSVLVMFGKLVLGLCLYMAMDLFIYFPWAQAVLGITSPFASPVVTIGQSFLGHNFYTLQPISGVLPTPTSLLTGPLVGQGGGALQVVIGLCIVALACVPLLVDRDKRSLLVLSIWAFILLLGGFLLLINSAPDLVYFLVTSSGLLLLPLVVLNQAAQWWFVLTPWEIILLFLSALRVTDGSLLRTLRRLDYASKSLAGPRVRSKLVSRPWSLYRRIIGERRSGSILTGASITFVVLLICTNASTSLIPIVQSEVSATASPTQTAFDGGPYALPNHIPLYVLQLERSFANLRGSEGPFRVMWFPSSPGINQWIQIDPYSIYFPPPSQVLLDDFDQITADVQQNASVDMTPLLTDMGIRYIVVLLQLNQTGSEPAVFNDSAGPFALLGNPRTMNQYLERQSNLSLISSNSNYSLFLNLNSDGLFQSLRGVVLYNGPAELSLGSGSLARVPSSPSPLPNQSAAIGFNIVVNPMFAPENESWTPLGNGYQESNASRWGRTWVQVTSGANGTEYSSAFGVSYNTLPDGVPNRVAILPGQEYLLGGSLVMAPGTQAVISVGGQLINLTNKPSGLVQAGPFNVSGIPVFNFSVSWTVPNGSYVISPLFIVRSLQGSFQLTNFTITYAGTSFVNKTISFLDSAPRVELNPYSYYGLVKTEFRDSDNLGLLTSLPSDFAGSGVNVIPISPVGNFTSNTSGLGIFLPGLQMVPDSGLLMRSSSTLALESAATASAFVYNLQDNIESIWRICGFGVGSVSVSSVTVGYDLRVGSPCQAVYLNASGVGQSTLFSISNLVGVISLVSILVQSSRGSLNPLLLQSVSNLTGSQTWTVVGTETSDSQFLLTALSPISRSCLLLVHQAFVPGWFATYMAGGEQRISEGFEINGWETAFVLTNGTLWPVKLTFSGGSFFESSLVIEGVSSIVAVGIYLVASSTQWGFLIRMRKFIRQEADRP